MVHPQYEIKRKELIVKLIEQDFIKFGEYKLKSGAISNYYVDLRNTSEHLDIFELLIDLIKEVIVNKCPEGKFLAGVPYGTFLLVGALARECKMPSFGPRKEIKAYGNPIKSLPPTNDPHILIEDVISSGSSIIETIEKMSDRKISDIIVIVNRKQGGDEKLRQLYPHIKIHSIIDVDEILNYKK